MVVLLHLISRAWRCLFWALLLSWQLIWGDGIFQSSYLVINGNPLPIGLCVFFNILLIHVCIFKALVFSLRSMWCPHYYFYWIMNIMLSFLPLVLLSQDCCDISVTISIIWQNKAFLLWSTVGTNMVNPPLCPLRIP